MYTIQYFYDKFLAKIDKEGSDLYSPEVIMEILQTATYDFIEETVKYLANTQQLRDFLMPLYTPYDIALAANPSNASEMLGSLPSAYLNLETIQITDSVVTVRRTKLYRTGTMDANMNNPNKKPTAEYPSVILYQTYIAAYGSSNQTKATGFYIAKPTFGDWEGVLTSEIAVNLPDNTVEKIMNLMVSMIHAKEGDPRYQLAYNQEQSSGKEINNETEEQILYQILDRVRASQINNDEPVDEREIRANMRTHRATLIRQASKDGILISESEFQTLGVVSLVAGTTYYEYSTLPNIIRLKENFGIKITTATGYNIPVLSREDFMLSLKIPLASVRPKAYFDNSKLYIYQGLSNPDMMNSGGGLNTVIGEINTDLKAYLEFIAYNPDDVESYDWTTSPYPLSAELISVLKDQLLRKEFGITIESKIKVDEVTNAKHDTIRYQDQGKID